MHNSKLSAFVVPAALAGLAVVASAAPTDSRTFVFFESGAAVYDTRTLGRIGFADAPGSREAISLRRPGADGEYYMLAAETITVLDEDLRNIAAIPLPSPAGAGPSAAAATPDGYSVLVASSDGVIWVDSAARTINAVLDPGFAPDGVLIPAGSGRAYVLSRNSRRIAVLDLDSRRFLEAGLWLPERPTDWKLGADGRGLIAAGDGYFPLDLLPASTKPTAAGATSPQPTAVLVSDPSLPTIDRASRLLRRGGDSPATAALAAEPLGASTVGRPVEQSATGSLLQQFGSGQTVAAGSPFQIGVRALTARGVPMIGLTVAVSETLPAGNAVVCQPGVTDTAGVGEINCVASGVTEDVDLSITVTDALGRLSAPFQVRVEKAQVSDGLRSLTGTTVTTPRNNAFQIVVQAATGDRPQPGLDLTVTADPGFPLLDCPSLFRTDVDGIANVLCRANNVGAPAIATVTISDGFGRRVDVTVVVAPHPTLGDGPHKSSGDGQTMTRFGVLAAPLVVAAIDGGLPREKVELAVSVSDALLFCPTKVVTDVNGLARIICSAGQTFNTHFAKVFVEDPEGRRLSAPFEVTIVPIDPNAAETLFLNSEDEIEGQPGIPIRDAIDLTAVDGVGDEVPGESVFFSAVGDVFFDPSVDVSDPLGRVSTTLTPGCPARPELIQVGLGGDTPEHTVKLNVLPGPPRIIAKTRGDLQQGSAGELLTANALVVRITDICGTALLGVPVEWSVEAGSGARLENVIDVTDGNGRSSALARLGDRAGPFRVTARAADLAVVFTLAVRQIPSAVEAVSGDAQRVQRGIEAPEPLTIRVRDQDGGPIEGVPVRFAVTAGVATVSNSFVRTNTNGEASTRVTAGDRLGRVNVVAQVTPEVSALTLEGTAGADQSALFHIFTLDVIGGAPSASAAAFVNGASFAVGWTPGSIGTIFGRDLVGDLAGPIVAGPAPFPTRLEGVSVTVNGAAAPIVGLARSGGQDQVNVQVPFGVDEGRADVVLENNGSTSSVEGVLINLVQPGIFQFRDGQSFLAAALHADFSPVTRLRPAAPGETILLFVTGLGPVVPQVATNEAGPNPPARTATEPIVGIDGEGMPVVGAFYAPGLVGTYQINFTVASTVQPGDRRLSVIQDGAPSQDVILPVGPAAVN